MKEAAAIGAMSDESPGARQRSHVAREKWEESWIAQQRSVTAVIAQAPFEGGVALQNGRSASTDRQGAAAQISAVPSHPLHGIAAAASEWDRTRTSEQPRAAATAFRRASMTAHGAHAPGNVELRTTAQAPRGEETRALRDMRVPLRNSAFWRREGAIEAAMRLRDPRQDADRVIAQLRHWLRESGAVLRRVLINGRVAWQAHSPDRPAAGHEPSPHLNRHI